MYYYAWIDSSTFICYEVIESETPITDDPYSIQIDSYDRSYINRKKYIDGVWLDATPIESQAMQAEVIGIGEIWLDDKIYEMEDDIANHTHTGYATSDNLQVLEDIIGTKANVTHTHTEYADANHSHTDYVTQTALDTLETKVDGKANASHSHTGYADVNHTHTASEIGAAASGHNHDDDYSAINHSHTIYATTTALSELSSTVSSKANASHSHNDTYYTETEVDTLLSGKSDTSHTHTISNITNLQATLDGKASTSHGTHVSYSTTTPVMDGNASVGTASTVARSDHKHPTDTSRASQADLDSLETVVASKASSSHTHSIANVTNLQTALDGKAASSHTHTVANISDLTATATELNYMDGVTSNVQVQLDGKSNTSHTHNYAGSSSVGGSATSAVKLDTSTAGDSNTPVYFSDGKPVACTSLDLNTSGSSASCTGNSSTATKLQTARTIGLDTGAIGTATSFDGSKNITIPVTNLKEAYLTWGGKNLSGSVSPLDAACSNLHSANRFAFAKPEGITIEYSTNGSTYSAYSTTDAAKINLVSGNGNTYYIGARSISTTVNDKLRITLNATNMGLYTRLQKILINISTSYATGSNVIIEKAMKGSETTFTTVGTYQISGWSGWNSIPISAAFGGGSNQTSNIAVLRLTFGITGVNSEQTSNALSVSDIIGIGDTYWSHPSTMAKTGHIYTYDSSQNATFPANITATTFIGALSGNATTATTATNVAWSGVTSKPSYYDAKAIKGITRSGTTFTYTCMDGTTGTFTQQDNNTTYSVVTTSANGLMSATDKIKLDAMELATLAEVKTYLGI